MSEAPPAERVSASLHETPDIYGAYPRLNEMQIAYSRVDNGTPRTTEVPEVNLSNGTDFGVIAALGTNSFEQNDHQESFSVKNNVTIYGGDNVFKFGGKISFNRYERTED